MRTPDCPRDRLRELADAPPKRGWSVKDSFALHDLAEFGLRALFDAQWYAYDGPPAGESERIRTPDALEEWERAWGVTSPAEQRIFPPSLLDDADIAFHAMPGGGFITNLSEGVVGVSNAFGSELDALRIARGLSPDRTVVGYGALMPEVNALGPLRVWVAE